MINVVAYLYSNKNNWILYEVVVLLFCCHGLFALRCIISVALNGVNNRSSIKKKGGHTCRYDLVVRDQWHQRKD